MLLFCLVVRDVAGMAQNHVAQLSSGTVGSRHAAAACWRAARCFRWWNEPSEQETAPHAIGIVFENRKGTCSLLMGLFLWHNQRQALCLTFAWEKGACVSMAKAFWGHKHLTRASHPFPKIISENLKIMKLFTNFCVDNHSSFSPSLVRFF